MNSVLNRWILGVGCGVFAVMEVQAVLMGSRYAYDIPMVLILLLLVFDLREKIYLHWSHYFLFFCFLMVHAVGLYGTYDWYPFGVEYDYWVHGFFGFVSTLMITEYFERSGWVSRRAAGLAALVLVLGISAAHELYEFAGAMLLGEGEGVLFIGAGDLDEWDTQKDMLNNVIGSLIALGLSAGGCGLKGWFARRSNAGRNG